MEKHKKILSFTCLSYSFVLISLLIVILFHFFREDHDPIMQTMSEYTIGPYGFFFPIALIILGLSSVTSFYTLFQTLPKIHLSKRIIQFFALWMIFIFITGIFPTDYITGPYTISGIIHALASYFAFSSLLVCIYFVAVFFKKNESSRVDYMRFYVYFFFAVPGLIIFLIIPLEYKGLIQRVFLVIILIAYLDIITIPLRNID